jgi:hypothetical protein
MNLEFDPDHSQIFLRGLLSVPVEELRAINLDPRYGAFRFQATIKPKVTRHGHLILEFPLNQTFFYPAISKNPAEERVIIPVQLLSMALASARGYMAALSGDFSGFDRRTEKLTAMMKSLDHSIAAEKNKDAREEMKVQKELNINQDLGARKNALILKIRKIRLSQLVPFLDGVDLGGIRMILDKKDGDGEKYLAIDVTSQLASSIGATNAKAAPRLGMKVAPALILRLRESIFESKALRDAEKKSMGSNIQDLELHMKDDGLHVTGIRCFRSENAQNGGRRNKCRVPLQIGFGNDESPAQSRFKRTLQI